MFVATYILVLATQLLSQASAAAIEMLTLPQSQPNIISPYALAASYGININLAPLPTLPPSNGGWGSGNSWSSTTSQPSPGWSGPGEAETTGWSSTTTAPPPPGWSPPPSTTTTVGWSAPTTTPGWSSPDVSIEMDSEAAAVGWGAAGASHSSNSTATGDDASPGNMVLYAGSYANLEQGVDNTQISSIDSNTGDVSTINSVLGYNSASSGDSLNAYMSGDTVNIQNEGSSYAVGEGAVAMEALTEVNSR